MSRRRETVRLATRGSDLALRQARAVSDALETRRLQVELVEVETAGDRIRDELVQDLGTTGAFVRSLDEEVLDGAVDGAVHSMKDMPTDVPDDLVVAGVPERATPGDLLVTPDGASLEDLPTGATVGTSSLRRQAQVRHRRPDLAVAPLRGNVDTRIEKLLAPARQREHERRLAAAEGESLPTAGGDDSGAESGDDPADDTTATGDDAARPADATAAEVPPDDDRTVEEWFDDLAEVERRAMERAVETEYDAIVLAAAGLERSGLVHQVPTRPLPTDAFVPAPGQGAIAVTMLDGDLAETVQGRLDHPRTRVETTAERAVLAELGGGCVAPVGVHAVLQGEFVTTAVQVFDRAGETVVADRRDLPVERYAAAAREFAADLADRGAADLVEAARREEPDAAKRGEDGG